MHTKIRVESQLIEEVREVAAANGVRSATALVNWLIAAGLDDLRSGRLRVQRGMMLERVEQSSQSEPRNAGRRQRSRAASKRTASPQESPATNPAHSDPHQSETAEARRSRGHQSTQLRSAPVGSQPTSNPAHSDPQQSEANPHPASGPSIRSSREPTLPRGTEAALWWTHRSRPKTGQFKLVLASSFAADWRCPTTSSMTFRSAFGYLSTIQAPPPCPVR